MGKINDFVSKNEAGIYKALSTMVMIGMAVYSASLIVAGVGNIVKTFKDGAGID